MKIQKQIIGGMTEVDSEIKPVNIKDNLYLNVNYEWLKKAKIPVDKPATGSFQALDELVEKRMIRDFKNYHQDKFKAPNPMFKEAMKMHELALNFEEREKQGVKPLVDLIKPIQKLKMLNELSKQLPQWFLNALPLPFKVDVEPDWRDTSKNAVFLYGPDLILPDKTYYQDKEKSKKLLHTWSLMTQQLLKLVSFNKEDATQIVEEALEFDSSLVPYVMTAEELADEIKQYNSRTLSEVKDYSKSFNLKKLIARLVDDYPSKIIVTQPRYFEAFDKIVNDMTFNNLKSWMLTKTITRYAPYLNESIRQLADQFQRELSGVKKSASQDKFAYSVIDDTFKYVIGDYYGHRYFSESAKQDAIKMIQKMISVYQKCIQKNDWLGEQTKKKALLKLSKITIKVGYPEKIKSVYQKLHVDLDCSLLENYINIKKIFLKDNLEQYHRPVDRSQWDMPPHLVNACYDPSRNDITFPAAILTKPFYDIEQTPSENYGGIGCVMGHEISHAFDNNGAHFDEYGNLVNWWSESDLKYFEKLTQKMIDEFDGIPFAGGKVNGKLIVSENIADNGGMSCSLEALKQDDNNDLKEFFINWARIWRMKASRSYQQVLLATDVHAPQELRANVQVQNFDDFYQAFGIHQDDGMWLDPQKRIVIW